MRTVIKNEERYENGKVVQVRVSYDRETMKYHHERIENGKKVKEWVTEK